jgi:hypothetical protein
MQPHNVVVQDVAGYNSWPMIQAIGDKLVCAYSRGVAHDIRESVRAAYARTSADGGKTWTPEIRVVDTPGFGDVPIGKGLDSTGAMLLWVRHVGQDWSFAHTLFLSTDGVTFVRLATPKLDPVPVQITDVFEVPTVGLMALWFAGTYRETENSHSWGTLTSGDNGLNWIQTTIESGLAKADWPTEQSAVWLGNGKILAIARTEGLRKRGDAPMAGTQFQLVSTDHGKTWTRRRTNIGDVASSTPSLVLDAATGLLSNYYYQRGEDILWRRVVKPAGIFDAPSCWPEPKAVAFGRKAIVMWDAGNVNVVASKGVHYCAFYSGNAPDTAVLLCAVPAPRPQQPPEVSAPP